MELCLELAYIHLGTLSVFERRGRYYGHQPTQDGNGLISLVI